MIDKATLTHIASEAKQAIQASNSLWEGNVCPANPLIPVRHDGVQAVKYPSVISSVDFSYRAQNSLNSGWLMPIDASFLQQDKLE